jgi:hypothetical protein
MAVQRVSITKVKKILLKEAASTGQKMRTGVFGNPLQFKLPPPNTTDEVGDAITTFTQTQTAFETGGSMQKSNYTNAIGVLYGIFLAFAPYISKAANGNEDILALGALPLTGIKSTTPANIKKGLVPTNPKGVAGGTGIIKTSCDVYGTGATYTAILVPIDQLPGGSTASLKGQIGLPPSLGTYYVSLNGKRETEFVGIPSNIFFWLIYVVSGGGVTSGYSAAVKVSAGT